jgi:hydrogenase nickel incorporation protein HypB
MCTKCGCAAPSNIQPLAKGRRSRSVTIDVMQRLLAENDRIAARNRARFNEEGVLVINLMSSPGAGKTSLLEATIVSLRDQYRIGVVEGDLETDNDAARIRAHGVPAVQITTGTTCHLDAQLIHSALRSFPIEELDILFIENVGNLVCPASFDLGQHKNVTLLSTTEGDDKPEKYPVIFRASDLVVLSKMDLLDVIDDFSPVRAEASLRQLGLDIPLVQVATRRRPMLQPWLDWLKHHLEGHQHSKKRTTVSSTETADA